MSFLHLSLLAGLGAITVPLLLHLFGQRKPKEIVFPALQFVRKTKKEQSTSWQLRHFLLLLLRILLLAALVFALSRPRVHSAALGSIVGISVLAVCAALATVAAAVALASKRPISIWATTAVIALALWLSAGLWGLQSLTTGPVVPSADEKAPVAAAIIVDNGPTMAYQASGASRLDAAKEMGTWILDQLPIDSRVGVLSGAPISSLSLDPAAAKTQLTLIKQSGVRVDLLSRIQTSLDLVLADELERKEIYIITDLMAPAWRDSLPELQQLLDQNKEQILLQIIDLGVEDNANWQLGDAVPDFSSAPVGADVTVEVTVTRPNNPSEQPSGGASDTVTVELLREEIDPSLPRLTDGQLTSPTISTVDRAVVDISDGPSASVALVASDLPEGTNNLIVRLDRPDPLLLDNQRYLSIPVQPQPATLIVASDPAIGRLLKAVVNPTNPDGATAGGNEQLQYVQLESVALDDFPVVCLYDPPALTAKAVDKLAAHIRRGTGLLLILGPQLPAAAQQGPIAKLLPGNLTGPVRRDRREKLAFLQMATLTHPIFAEFGDTAGDTLWNLFPIYNNWSFEALDPSAQTLMAVSDDGSPAVVSHRLDRGQIITFTTPIPEPDTGSRELWNRLWASDNFIPSFGLLLGTLRALSGADRTGFSFSAGEQINLANESSRWPSRYTLYAPNRNPLRVDAALEQLNLGRFDVAGTHYLRGQRTVPLVRGFSVNVPAEDCRLTRLTTSELDALLGADNYHLAQNRDEVESSVGTARFGRELYPLLMLLVAGLFLAEQAMSNRFYTIHFGRASHQ